MRTIEPIFVFDQHFTVRGTVSPTGAGTVNGGGSYRPHQTVELEAEPYNGYEFVRWSDGRTENPRTIVAVKQFELTAIFHSVRTEEFWLEERRCSIEGNGTELHYGDEIEVTYA